MDSFRDDTSSPSSRDKQTTEDFLINASQQINKCMRKKIGELTEEERKRKRLYERDRKRLQRAKLKAKKIENSDPLAFSVTTKQIIKGFKKATQQSTGNKKKTKEEENEQYELSNYEIKQLQETNLKAIKLEELYISEDGSTSSSLPLISLRKNNDNQKPDCLFESLQKIYQQSDIDEQQVSEREDKCLQSPALSITKNSQRNYTSTIQIDTTEKDCSLLSSNSIQNIEKRTTTELKGKCKQIRRKKKVGMTEEELEEYRLYEREKKRKQRAKLKAINQGTPSDFILGTSKSKEKNKVKSKIQDFESYFQKNRQQSAEYSKKKKEEMTEEEREQRKLYEREKKRLQRAKLKALKQQDFSNSFKITAQSIKKEVEYFNKDEEFTDPLFCYEINAQPNKIKEKLENFVTCAQSKENGEFSDFAACEQSNEFEEFPKIKPCDETDSKYELLKPLEIQPKSTITMQKQKEVFKINNCETDNLKKGKKSRYDMTEEELEKIRKNERERKRKQRLNAKGKKLKIFFTPAINEKLKAQNERKAELRKFKKEQMTEEEKEELKRYEREKKRAQRARLKAQKMEESFDPLEMLFVSCSNDNFNIEM